ncbi:protein of unknown function [Nitrospira defluvii]|uniref:Uncharacterized protein n=1 Tax=Nitrospira defluvii TaxID=330214 RepID=D8P8Q7_9BACT|nr:protein of unknown function [Nitrospira defluvii]
MVCDSRANGKWIHLGHFLASRKEGERKLRWLRQWHPTAFLMEADAKKCLVMDDNPLPVRSPKESPAVTERPRLRLVGLVSN